MIYHAFKRALDFTCGLIGLLILSPIIIIVFILLLFANAGKPIFFQKRPGKNEKIFTIYKFKTMNDKTDSNGELLPDGKRLTPVGGFIRKTSFDEIPQLFNILKGDMSFIGPRPLIIRYLPYYTSEEKIRHSIRPGISGLAQISGRNLLKWDDRLKKDIEYVKNISFQLDLKILFKTILKVIQSKDIVVDSTSNMLALDEERKLSIK